MGRGRSVAIVVGLLLIVAAGGPGVVSAQEDRVTLTIAVETPDGDPVSDATLTVLWDGGSATGTTFANGKAFVDVPEGADLEVRVSHADYVRNHPLEVDDASEREVDMTVYEKASARITVADADGPVANASVTFSKDGTEVLTATTGANGDANSGTVEVGTYDVAVSKPGYYVAHETLDLDGQTSETITVERGTVTLEVNVTDDHFSPPQAIGAATVEVAGSGSVTTQPTGIGRISVPVNAWATVSVSKDGYRSAARSAFVAEDDTSVDVTIHRTPAISLELLSARVVVGESVSLTVTDEYGDPVSGATVRVDGESVAETDADGEAVIRVEGAGDHEVVAERGSLSTGAQTLVGVSAEGEATPTAAPGTTDVPGGMPGFGLPAAALALAGVLVLARRRR